MNLQDHTDTDSGLSEITDAVLTNLEDEADGKPKLNSHTQVKMAPPQSEQGSSSAVSPGGGGRKNQMARRLEPATRLEVTVISHLIYGKV
jgi:hypothetical protein